MTPDFYWYGIFASHRCHMIDLWRSIYWFCIFNQRSIKCWNINVKFNYSLKRDLTKNKKSISWCLVFYGSKYRLYIVGNEELTTIVFRFVCRACRLTSLCACARTRQMETEIQRRPTTRDHRHTTSISHLVHLRALHPFPWQPFQPVSN
jgi:hypothetical protein